MDSTRKVLGSRTRWVLSKLLGLVFLVVLRVATAVIVAARWVRGHKASTYR